MFVYSLSLFSIYKSNPIAFSNFTLMKSVLICVVMVLALAANAQRNGNIPAKSAMHHEVMEQPYVQDDLSKHPRSKAYTYKGCLLYTSRRG